MSIDTIGNFLTIIRNGKAASKPAVTDAHSKVKESIAAILKEEGFIKDFVVEGSTPATRRLKVVLKYVDGESVIHAIDRVSKPSRRVYRGGVQVAPVIGGLGISILTTSQGIMTNKKARELSVGGEVICTVW